MLRKLLISVLFICLVLALAVGCSSKGSKNDAETTAQVEKTATVEATAVVETETSQAPAEEQKVDELQEADSVEDTAEEDIEFVMPSTLAEKFSYAFGAYVASYYGADYSSYYYALYQAQVYPELDLYYGSMGIYDYLNDSLRYTIDELNQMINDYLVDYDMRMAALADENLAKAEAFLKENAKKEGILTTESGLQYEIVRQGDGAMAKETDSVELDYELKLMDGTVIDSSYARGEHSTFPLSGVIEGFREGVMLMPMGSHYVFYIHPSLGYGDQATASMDPNSLLIFNVETYSIQGE